MTLQEKKIIETPKMTHITELSIHNFRAIRDLTYAPKQINILTGRNNTGKTALLDAIALNIPGYVDSEIENTIIRGPVNFITDGERSAQILSNLNSVTIYPDVKELKKNQSDILTDFFDKDFESTREILEKSEMKKIIENKQFQKDYIDLFNEYFDCLTFISDFGITVCPYLKQRVRRGKQYADFSMKFDNSFKKLIKQYSEEDTTYKGERRNSILYHMSMYPGNIVLREKPSEDTKKFVKISHSEKLSFDEISEEELVVLTEFIIENNVVGNLKRLSQTDVVYKRDNALVTIPISAHGDGFIALLNTIRYIMRAKNGILLIEEPENHLHPRYIDIFIQTIFEFCQKLNVQVFLSTHSLDLIRSALKYPETSEEKQMLFISKMTSDGENVEKFDYTVDEGLKVIDELYLDLRGN